MSGPSVPYAGNPSSYPTSVNVLSGSDTPNSTTFNTTSEGGLDRSAWIRASVARPGQSWQPSWSVSGLGGASTPQMYKGGVDANFGVFLVPYAYLSGGTWSLAVSELIVDYGVGPGPAPLVNQTITQPILVGANGLASGWSASSADILAVSGPGTATFPEIVPLVGLVDGAELQSLSVFFKVVSHSGVPSTMPSLLLRRRTMAAGVPATDVYLSSTNQQFVPTPGSGSAWYDSGNQQSFAYTCNQNNTIDTSQYQYYLEVYDEGGTNAVSGNSYYGVALTYLSPDGGAPSGWHDLANQSSPTTADATGIFDAAVCGDPSSAGTIWCAALTDSGAQLQVSTTAYGSSSWTSRYTTSTSGLTFGTVEIAGIGNLVAVGVGCTAGSQCGVYAGGIGTSFSKVSSISVTGPLAWKVVSNGSLLIALPTFTRQATPQLWKTVDGVTWTAENISGIVPVGSQPTGLAWSPLNSLWYMLVATSSTATVYSSPDGITWTAASGTISSSGFAAQDLAVIGNGLVVTSADEGSRSESQYMYSADWGATWTLSPSVALEGNLSTGAVGYSRARLVSNGVQLLVNNSQNGRFGDAVSAAG